MTKTQSIEWQAVQVCGECGRGYFRESGAGALCDHCGHEHPMDAWNLDEREAFVWTEHGLLSVVSYEHEEVSA